MKYFVFAQYRESSKYNDFIGKYYHFPKKYLNYLPKDEPFEFIYYEPKSKGKDEYFGAGVIDSKPIPDKNVPDHYFIEIKKYYKFSNPVKGIREPKDTFNQQNAVRNITFENYESICLEGGIQYSFEADAHLMDVLGEKLIASEKVGVLELIKNSFDAQASYCNVYLENIPNINNENINNIDFKYGNEFKGPVIVIEDNGIGMDLETIKNGWLRPASVIKTNIKDRLKREYEKALEHNKLDTYESLTKQLKKEHKGRIPLGEKGVGRFAVHRLGRYLRLVTKIKKNDFSYVLNIDWENFNNSCDFIDLNQIGITIEKEVASVSFPNQNSGTKIIIYGGRKDFGWTEGAIRDLNYSIINLNPPFINEQKEKNRSYTDHDFFASLICPQVSDLEKSIITDDLDSNFRITGIVDKNGIFEYDYTFIPPKNIPFKTETEKGKVYNTLDFNKNYWNKRNPVCGQFFVDFRVWYRLREWSITPDFNKLMEYLDNHGGVSVYRDGLNIFPAATGKKSDWLGLSQDQIKRSNKLSYYHMIGSVEIDQTSNLSLVDKTNREGMIENQAYRDFEELLKSIIKVILETKYKSVRDRYRDVTKDIIRDSKTLASITKQSADIISSIKDSYPIVDDPYSILSSLGDADKRQLSIQKIEKTLNNIRDSIKVLDEAKDLMTEQAGFGLAIAVSIHEIGKVTNSFYHSINNMLKKGIDNEKLIQLRESSVSLRSELRRLSPLRAVRNERRRVFSISEIIKYSEAIYRERLKKLDFKFIIDGDDFEVFVRFGAITQVFGNLITNSMYWTSENENRIIVKLNADYRYVVFADNGPNISDIIRPNLFQPGYSLKEPASGLGLYISRYYLQDIKGDIRLSSAQEEIDGITGAQFTLDFRGAIKKENYNESMFD